MSLCENSERLSDVSDKASNLEELARISAMATSRRPEGPSPTGYCLWCDEEVKPYVRWCCVSCRDEWQKKDKR